MEPAELALFALSGLAPRTVRDTSVVDFTMSRNWSFLSLSLSLSVSVSVGLCLSLSLSLCVCVLISIM